MSEVSSVADGGMARARRAVAGGVAGVAVMSAVLLVGEAQARFLLRVPTSIARFVGMPGKPYLGFVLFVLAGAVAWPLLFVGVERALARLPGGADPAVRGIAFALVLWVAFLLLGATELSGGLLAIYVAFTLLAHLAYGFALGAVYGRLGRA